MTEYLLQSKSENRCKTAPALYLPEPPPQILTCPLVAPWEESPSAALSVAPGGSECVHCGSGEGGGQGGGLQPISKQGCLGSMKRVTQVFLQPRGPEGFQRASPVLGLTLQLCKVSRECPALQASRCPPLNLPSGFYNTVAQEECLLLLTPSRWSVLQPEPSHS